MFLRGYFLYFKAMNPRVFIIHGYKGSSDRGWKYWLARQLKDLGYEVYAPAMPDPFHPTKDEWVQAIAELVVEARPDDILVGHSLGTIAILRYLESLEPKAHVGKTILVASFGEAFEDEDGDAMKSFVETPMQWDKVRAASKDFTIIHSDDDDVVPLSCGQSVARNLGVSLDVLKGFGHFSYHDGVRELPIVLEKILV